MSVDADGPAMPWRSDLLSSLPGIAHGVTWRVAGLGRANGNVAFSAPRDREDAWTMRQWWCSASGFAPEHLVTLGQVHGRDVHVVTAAHVGHGAMPGSPPIGLGDALITNQAGPVLMTLHADCQPILFVDPGSRRRGPAVGVAHAGWRGTVAGVAAAMLEAMAAAYGARPEDVHVCLGPAIGSCCYDVGDDVVSAWRHHAGNDAEVALERSGERYRYSLTAANALLLDRAGVRAANVEASAICTKCHGDRWFSHRDQGAHTGRFGAMIALRGDGVTG